MWRSEDEDHSDAWWTTASSSGWWTRYASGTEGHWTKSPGGENKKWTDTVKVGERFYTKEAIICSSCQKKHKESVSHGGHDGDAKANARSTATNERRRGTKPKSDAQFIGKVDQDE